MSRSPLKTSTEDIKVYFFISREYVSPKNVQMPKPWIVHQNDSIHSFEDFKLGKQIFLHFAKMPFPWIKSTPNIETELTKNFRVKSEFIQSANKTIQNILKQYKKKKRQKLIKIGVHIRRTDFQARERVRDEIQVNEKFYIKAMEKFQRQFGAKNVLFLIITDDVPWCEKHFTSIKDLYIVTDSAADPGSKSVDESIGHDLAIMSLCQHSIVSRGTFSGWASFLAGGQSISPYDLK